MWKSRLRCADDSVLKARLLDPTLELVTKYGPLKIPVADVRKVEFAGRIPADVADKVAAAVANLGHPDFATRDKASNELKGFRERAFSPP